MARLRNRSAEPDLNREHARAGEAVGARMYTFDSNPGQLMETSSPDRNVFFDPRSRRRPRDHGTLRDLKDIVVKYTRIQSCDPGNPDEMRRIERDVFNYDLIQPKIGGGAFGEVFAANRVRSDQLFAVKVYFANYDKADDLKDNPQAWNGLIKSLHEIIVMKALKGHPYFAQIADHFIINDRIYIVMEMEDGTLSSQISNYPNGMREDKCRAWFYQMAHGLAYMHRIGITHGDIHSGNILIRKLNNGSTICKWTDFGMSKFIHPRCYQNIRGWISAEQDLYKGGHIGHRSPKESHATKRLRDIWIQEARTIVLQKASQDDIARDVSKLGRLLLNMLGNCGISYEDDISRMTQEEFLQLEVQSSRVLLSREAKDLLWTLLQEDDENRITSEQMIRHRWFLHPGFEPHLRTVTDSHQDSSSTLSMR